MIIRIRDAVCVLGSFPALAGVNLDVAAGEIVLLSGPNGAGKTTLLRLIAGLLPLRSGSALVWDHDLGVNRRGHRRRVALIGHDTGCYDELTVAENLGFGLRSRGVARADTQAQVQRGLSLFGLADIADIAHAKLSAGQRRRLALTIGLANEPDLLLLDEPHAGLDAQRRDVLDSVLVAAQDRGATIVMASHELDRSRVIATREVRIDHGLANNVEPIEALRDST